MTRVYLMRNERIEDQLRFILSFYVPRPITIRRTPNGKPYCNGIHFNYSHTGYLLVLAVSDTPVGVDVEQLQNHRHTPIIRRMKEEEQKEIKTEEDFLYHWTAKESLIKSRGKILAELLSHLSLIDGVLSEDGVPVPERLWQTKQENFILSVCGGSGEIQLIDRR